MTCFLPQETNFTSRSGLVPNFPLQINECPPMQHDKDFDLWSQEQVGLLRAGRFAELDIENLTDEIESLSKSDKRALKSHLIVIMLHLLKLTAQPNYLNRAGWLRSIRNAQAEITLILEDSPSLKRLVAEYIQSGYLKAKSDAEYETGLNGFPETCPFDDSILTYQP